MIQRLVAFAVRVPFISHRWLEQRTGRGAGPGYGIEPLTTQ